MGVGFGVGGLRPGGFGVGSWVRVEGWRAFAGILEVMLAVDLAK